MEIEKKISEAIDFIFLFFRSLGYFIFPWRIVDKIKSPTEVFPPLAFLAILSFFGLKLWTYFFLVIEVGHENNSLISSTDATLTSSKELTIGEFISIPGFEEIFSLTIPYIFLVIILSKLMRKFVKRGKIITETDLGDIIIYFCGFLVILFPVIFLLHEVLWFSDDTRDLKILLLLAIPPYLFLMFRSAISSAIKWKAVRVSAILSLLIPLLTLSFIFGSIYISTHVSAFENGDLAPANVNNYLKKELFETKLVSRKNAQDFIYWKILVRVTDEKAGEYTPCFHDLSGKVYGVTRFDKDSVIRQDLCNLEEVSFEMIIDSTLDSTVVVKKDMFNGNRICYETKLLYAKTTCVVDRNKYDELYVQLNVINAESVSPEKIVIGLWSNRDGINAPASTLETFGGALLKQNGRPG